MAELIRVGLVLDSSGVVKGAREATQVFSSLKKQVDDVQTSTKELVAPLRQLEGQYRTGRITLTQYREQLRTTRADLQSLANTVTMTAREEAGLAVQTKAVEAALRQADAAALRTQNAMVRVAGGVQTLAYSMQGGRVSAMGLLSALGTLGIGSAGFVAVLAGLAAVSAALIKMGVDADEASDALGDLANKGLLRLRGQLAAIQAEQSRFTRAGTAPAEDESAGDYFKRRFLNLFGFAARPDTLAAQESAVRGAILEVERTNELARRAQRGRPEAERARLGVRGIESKPTSFKPGGELLGGGVLDSAKASLADLKKMTKGFVGARDELLDIGSSLSSGLSAIGASLKDGFKGIGKAVLGIIGGMMQQIGKAMIAYGLAGKAIRSFIKNPALAVAAGAALVVMGAALASSAQGVVNRGEGGGSSALPPSFASGASGAGQTTIIQIVGQRSGEVIAEHSYEAGRYANRGGSSGTGQSAMVIPVTGQVVVRRV